MYSNRTTIQNKEHGSYCFTTLIESQTIAALLFTRVDLFEGVAGNTFTLMYALRLRDERKPLKGLD